jgi:hypothetical protein
MYFANYRSQGCCLQLKRKCQFIKGKQLVATKKGVNSKFTPFICFWWFLLLIHNGKVHGNPHLVAVIAPFGVFLGSTEQFISLLGECFFQ